MMQQLPEFRLDMQSVARVSAADFLARHPDRGRAVPLPEYGLCLYVVTSCLCFGETFQNIFPIMPDGSLPYMLEDAYDDTLIEGIVAPDIRRCLDFPIRRTGEAAPLFPLWSSINISHWLFQCLSVVPLLEQQGFSGSYIINNRPFASESLDILEIPRERVLRNDGIYAADAVWLAVEKPLARATANEALFFGLRNALRERVGTLPGKRRCYVRRPGQYRRKPANEAQVLVLLGEYGFESFEPDSHSLREQLLALSNSSFTLMPHGGSAALTLMQPKDTVFLEMFNPDYICYCFAPIARHLRMLYVPFPANDSLERGDGQADYHVDCGVLRIVVENILKIRG